MCLGNGLRGECRNMTDSEGMDTVKGRKTSNGRIQWMLHGGWMGCLLVMCLAMPGLMAKQLVVKWGKGIQATDGLSALSGVTVKGGLRIPATGKGVLSTDAYYRLIEVPDDDEDVMLALRSLPGVLSIEPHYPVYLRDAVFSDTLLGGQYYLSLSSVLPILEIVPTRQVLVAVLDTGASLTHPDLKGKWWVNHSELLNGIDDDQNGFIDDINGYAFLSTDTGVGHAVVDDPHGHGTHISGLIAAQVNNAEGVVGMAPMARILPVRMIDARGIGYQYDAAAALVYAVQQGADVINCSWGFTQYNDVLQAAIEYALQRHVLVVAAAGNSGSGVFEYPASFLGVIGVGSLNAAGNRSYFSNHHSRVKLYVYGEGMVSTGLNGTYKIMDGTSQAAGLFSGLLAHFISAFPAQSVSSIDRLLSLSAAPNGEVLPLLSPALALASYSVPTATIGLSMTTGVSSSFLPPAPSVMSVSGGELVGSVIQYPNPLREGPVHFSFVSSVSGQGTIRLYDGSGQWLGDRMFQVLLGQNVVQWDLFRELKGLRRGTYLYVLDIKTTQQAVRRRGKLTVLR